MRSIMRTRMGGSSALHVLQRLTVRKPVRFRTLSVMPSDRALPQHDLAHGAAVGRVLDPRQEFAACTPLRLTWPAAKPRDRGAALDTVELLNAGLRALAGVMAPLAPAASATWAIWIILAHDTSSTSGRPSLD
jgi:hypothetical protein